jgi:hypothetical protein
LDDLEPAHPRRLVYEHTSLAYYSYCQSIVRWKKVLLHYVPTAAELIDLLEMLHRLLLHRILRSFDGVNSGTDKCSTALAMGFVLIDIPSLRLCESVDQAEVEHLHAELEYRLLFLCNMVGLPTNESPVPTSWRLWRGQPSWFRTVSGQFTETSEYWPPGHCKNRRGHKRGDEGCIDCPQPPTLDVQPTPLQYLEAKPTCFPSTMMRCLPSHVLAFLGIDMESLAVDIHKPEGWIRRVSHPLPGIVVNALESDQEFRTLLQRIIRQALSMSLKVYFDVLESEMRSGNWQEELEYHDDREIREVERAMESPFRVGAFVGAARDLFEDFVKSGESGPSLNDNSPLSEWMKRSQIGKKAGKRLHETMVKLVEKSIWVRICISAEGEMHIGCGGLDM